MSQPNKRVLRHVVLFKFKADTTAAQVQQIEAAFQALPGKIDAMAGFEWGTDVSVEGKADGFTHCFFVTFRSEADRDAYLPHPAHREFGTRLRPHLDKVLVLDYWTQE
ncbi:MAG: Dabb family protein [Caldilineaceae bacterium]|nr:Dabb family protein [Caldilineaceae bacterium]